MKNLTKILCFLLFIPMLFLGVISFAGCSFNEESSKKSIVCTIFPEYDWAREILGEKQSEFSLTLLTSGGEDMHSYQPTFDDTIKIASADLFIYVGGESDEWVSNVLKNATNKNMILVNLLEVLGNKAKEEAIKEGMQGEADGEIDEHVWLSVKNAKLFVSEIAQAIAKLDEENENIYLENAKAYNEKLTQLDEKFLEAASSSSKNTLVFADRFPFRYLVDDYSLDYFAAFSGCSAESEADFETIIFLANKIDQLDLKYVFVIENSNTKLAQTVINSTTSKNQQIVVLNSLQSVSNVEGASYLSVMMENLETIKRAIN